MKRDNDRDSVTLRATINAENTAQYNRGEAAWRPGERHDSGSEDSAEYMGIEIVIVERTGAELLASLKRAGAANTAPSEEQISADERYAVAEMNWGDRKEAIDFIVLPHRLKVFKGVPYHEWLARQKHIDFWLLASSWSVFWHAAWLSQHSGEDLDNWPYLVDHLIKSDPLLGFLDLSHGYVQWDWQIELLYTLCHPDTVAATQFRKDWSAPEPQAREQAARRFLPDGTSLLDVLTSRARPGGWRALRGPHLCWDEAAASACRAASLTIQCLIQRESTMALTITPEQFFSAFNTAWETRCRALGTSIEPLFVNGGRPWTSFMCGPATEGDALQPLIKLTIDELKNLHPQLEYDPERHNVDAFARVPRSNLPNPAAGYRDYCNVVMVEVENRVDESTEEFWKLLHSRVPLKVLITYDYNDEKTVQRMLARLSAMYSNSIDALGDDSAGYIVIFGGRREFRKGEPIEWRAHKLEQGTFLQQTC
jgi:hypothetical protein